MTKIEKAVRIVSDLYDFYQRIPKLSPAKEKGVHKRATRRGPSLNIRRKADNRARLGRGV